MNVDAFLAELESDRSYSGQMAAHEVLPARPAMFAELEPLPPDPLSHALAGVGITAFYSHQAEAIALARERHDVVIATGTASGKTWCYNVPVIERILADRQARALYLFPLKALARDQLGKLNALGLWQQVRAAAYDGDTPAHERRIIRNAAHIVLTNPDMLHVGLLPRHQLWSEFLSRLEYIVIDELHTLRGVFGSHAALVLRRLLRLCERYGSHPSFIACSATIGNPADLAEQLTGRRFTVVDRDGAPAGARHIVVWNPPALGETGLRRSANVEATWLLAALVRGGTRTLAFTTSRQEAELVLRYLRAALDSDGLPPDRVAAYRAGYLATERRRIEQGLATGQLGAVISTVALEAGIDIGGLDAVVLVGYPGTVASLRQQMGRAGRGRADSLAILVTRASLIDQFYAVHPEALWSAPTEAARIDPDNLYILGGHLLCAAYESPLTAADLAGFGEVSESLLPIFTEEGFGQPAGDRWMYTSDVYPAGSISLRAADNQSYELVAQPDGTALGVQESTRVWEECYPGAIYLHEGEQYEVLSVTEAQHRIEVAPVDVDWFTRPLISFEVEIDQASPCERRDLGELAVHFGSLTVTKTTIGYNCVKSAGAAPLSTHDLVCPPQTFETSGLWLTLSPALLAWVAEHGGAVLGGLHAVEHALAAALPLVALCDLRDVQGTSLDHHPQLDQPALFIWDQYPGGVGLTERGFEAIEPLLAIARDVVTHCPCPAGCPACIQSPFCGANNQPLDKSLAEVVLDPPQ